MKDTRVAELRTGCGAEMLVRSPEAVVGCGHCAAAKCCVPVSGCEIHATETVAISVAAAPAVSPPWMERLKGS